MTRILILLVAVASLFPHPPPAAARTAIRARSGDAALRFHHLHVRVTDPAASMNALALKVQGTRVVLQGFGVGVRSGDQYVLFDRAGDDPGVAAADAAGRYRRGVAWLTERGAKVDPPDFSRSAFAALEIAGTVDHIGFSTSDLAAAVDALIAAGAPPVRRTDDAALFSTGNGELVEILRETDRPDAFWCPMHLDVRSAAQGKCAICGMDLVAIPPLRLGEYRLDVGFSMTVSTDVPPGKLARRLSGLQFRIKDPDGKIVTDFVTVHERPFHLFIISRNLDYFAHVHPEQVEGSGIFKGLFQLDLAQQPPLLPGAYMAFADVLPYGGTSQMLQQAFVTPGYTGALFSGAPPLVEGPAAAVVDGVRVRLADADLAAGKSGCVQFELVDAASNDPITDLEPFLGAPAHLLIVKPDLTDAIHVHPKATAAGGPVVSFDPLMPAPGPYKLWLQFQRRGKVSTASFVVSVR